MLKNGLLILDYGSQYTHIVAKTLRSMHIYSEVLPWNTPVQDIISKLSPKGIILSGGPHSVYKDASPDVSLELFCSGIPILGICYGMQLLASRYEGTVAPSHREFGSTSIRFYQSKLFNEEDISEESSSEFPHEVLMSHNDSVVILPREFKLIASTSNCSIAGIEHYSQPIYGLQFHPEVSNCQGIGKKILRNFAINVCGCSASWTPSMMREQLFKLVQEQVGEQDKVLLALSGGVDSSVAAAILHRVLGERLICFVIDTGLLRDQEVSETLDSLSSLGLHFTSYDASALFFDRLRGVIDPEKKRKVIGKAFIDVFEEIAAQHGAAWLAQGTIYSDVIESAQVGTVSSTAVIKSHHNVGGLPEDLGLQLLEPLRYLFKDEVRALGAELGLPSQVLNRHPFPGPGLGIRILGEVVEEYVNILRKADKIFLEELRRSDLYSNVSQAFAVFLPIKSVSVKGDSRCYGYTIALRAVVSSDFMTANWYPFTHEFLSLCSTRIINEISEVARVVYDISDKPAATIEWE